MKPWALALELSLVLAPLTARAAAPASPDARAASLSVELEGVEASLAERLEGEVETELRADLELRGVSIGAARGPKIEVHIELIDPAMLDYEIDVDVVDAERRERVVEGLICETCSERRLKDEVLGSGAKLVETLGLIAAPPVPACSPDDDAPEPIVPASSRDTSSRGAGSRLGPLGLVGVSALTAGTLSTVFGGLVAGGVLRSGPELGARYAPAIDDQSAGVLLVGVGAGVAALGIAALILDQTALEARRQRRLDVSVGLSREHAYLWLRGEF